MWNWFLGACLLASSLAQDGVDGFTKGQKWQIILNVVPDTSKTPLPPVDAEVWDVDLFDTNITDITTLKAAGHTVICYFSAGTYEDWREDAKQFPTADLGKTLKDWPDEKWIRTGSTAIRNIMATRIKLASTKNCDAIDPDNMDGYQNDNGLNLKSSDAIDYMKWLSTTAASYGMKSGLKNSLDIVDSVSSFVDFAVNEQCAQLGECDRYSNFLASNKPVFHIEYPTPLNNSLSNSVYCIGPGTTGMSTVLKNLALDGHVVYCDNSVVDTPVKGGNPNNPGRTTSRPPRQTSARPRPSTSTRTTTTTRQGQPPPPPTSAPARTSQEPPPPPTSTANSGGGGGGGCKAKHWDQCGGQNWKGCTQCDTGLTCKGVSPPYYYQCL